MAGRLPDDILAHYTEQDEKDRLDQWFGPLERARTREILTRHLPPPPGLVMDVGGAAGAYTFWLADQGYDVHLVDPVGRHIEQAREMAHGREDDRVARLEVGDARSLSAADGVADAVLLMGPLYHLTTAADRSKALQEARRVLRPGGLLFAAAISRSASLLDGLFRRLLDDPVFEGIVRRDLEDGQHRNPSNDPRYFTTAYFHDPAKIRGEIVAAGLEVLDVLAVEGPAWLLPDFSERWSDPARRAQLLEALRWAESEPSLLGASAHLLALARR